MKFRITEKQDTNSSRKGELVECKSIGQAKRLATRRQMFQNTVLVIEDKFGCPLSVKRGGQWDNYYEGGY